MIVAAAYRRDGKMYVGRRHSEVIVSMVRDFGITPPIGVDGDEDGFMTSEGKFVDRSQAFEIAKACGQLKHHQPEWGDCLYSESVW